MKLNSSEKDVGKIYKNVQDNYQLLRRYIDEVNTYTKVFHDRILSKLNLKAYTDILQVFQNIIEDKILSQLIERLIK
jgi:hypothetical protein